MTCFVLSTLGRNLGAAQGLGQSGRTLSLRGRLLQVRRSRRRALVDMTIVGHGEEKILTAVKLPLLICRSYGFKGNFPISRSDMQILERAQKSDALCSLSWPATGCT